ncbi:MAG: lytic transglycosylase domain-containing protein [Bacteroidota bacterium]
MKKTTLFLTGMILVVAASILVLCTANRTKNDTDPNQEYRDATSRFYKIFTVEIPRSLDFSGEKVPVDKFYVRESLDRELLVNTYWHSNTLLMFKRAFRWFPVIEPILKTNGIPDDAKYIALIESGFENTASPAGASGFWQLMKSTAESYGLEVNAEVDERYSVEKSTAAACKYLKTAYGKYKNWTLAAASYNMGMKAVDDAMAAQQATTYYDLYLNKETIRYVYRILAVKAIFQNPVKYGFYLRKCDFYPQIPANIVTVDSTVENWAAFAIKNNSNYRVLKEMNPWILKNSLINKNRKKYDVKFPKEGYTSWEQLTKENSCDNTLFNDTLKIDQIR